MGMSIDPFPMTTSTRFVDSLVKRIASFDKQAISQTKRFVDVASLHADYESHRSGMCAYASNHGPPRKEDRDGYWRRLS